MRKDIFKNETDKLVAKELANKFISILLSIAVMVLSIVVYKIYTEEKVIVKTTNMSKEFWVTSNEVSQSYLEQMGQYISTALFNVSPNSAQKQFDLILDLAAPSFYQSLKSELINQRKYVAENGITSAFYLKEIKGGKDHIQVKGTKNNIIGDKVVEKRDVVLNIYFTIQNGRFYISSFEIK